jgi:hypothetical protein
LYVLGPNELGPSTLEVCGAPPNSACLRRNWLRQLSSLQLGELTANSGARSYRMVFFPPCAQAMAVEIDVHPNGEVVVTTSQAPAPVSWRNPAYTTPDLQAKLASITSRLPWRSTAPGSPADVESVEKALKTNWFSYITADPAAVPTRGLVFDGVLYVIEADVDGRYRYVARDSGELNDDMVERMASVFFAIANRRTPGSQPMPPC